MGRMSLKLPRSPITAKARPGAAGRKAASAARAAPALGPGAAAEGGWHRAFAIAVSGQRQLLEYSERLGRWTLRRCALCRAQRDGQGGLFAA